MTIGEKIRFLRMSNELTQEELADAVGTKKQTIHKYETGIISNIPASKIKSLADKLNTTPAYLMGWEDEKGVSLKTDDSNTSSNSSHIPFILEKYNKLNDNGKKKANEYIIDLSENPNYVENYGFAAKKNVQHPKIKKKTKTT